MAELQWPAGRAAMLASPVCAYCKRLEDSYERTCEAFREIPDKIFNGENDHTKPFAGDGGKQFVPWKENWQAAERMSKELTDNDYWAAQRTRLEREYEDEMAAILADVRAKVVKRITREVNAGA